MENVIKVIEKFPKFENYRENKEHAYYTFNYCDTRCPLYQDLDQIIELQKLSGHFYHLKSCTTEFINLNEKSYKKALFIAYKRLYG